MRVQACNYLLDAGADVNAKNGIGQTPLLNAIAHNDVKLCRLFLDSGADQSGRSVMTGGLTPLEFAKKLNFDAVAKLLAKT